MINVKTLSSEAGCAVRATATAASITHVLGFDVFAHDVRAIDGERGTTSMSASRSPF